MSSQSLLLNMPDDVMRKILDKCDFLSMLILRKTCHDFRNFIDDTKPETHIGIIGISGTSTKISLSITFGDNLQLYPEGQKIKLKYEKIQENCQITWKKSNGNRTKLLENFDFLDIFCRDFERYCMNIKLEHFWLNPPIEPAILSKIKNILQNSSFRTKTFVMFMKNQEEILQILPYLDSKFLKNLGFIGPENPINIDKLVDLPQWKQAEVLNIRRFPVLAPIQKFKNFEIAKVCFESISMTDIIYLKEIFTNSASVFKHFQLFFQQIFDQQTISRDFGQPHEDTDNFFIARKKSWFFKRIIDELVVCIEYHPTFFVFKIVENVPNGVNLI